MALLVSDALAQRAPDSSIRDNGCLYDGLVATGLFDSGFSATQSALERNEGKPTDVQLICENQRLVLTHRDFVGTSSEHWYEYWNLVHAARDAVVYNSFRLVFSRLGEGTIVGVLTFTDYQTTSPSVLFVVEGGYSTRQFFGRVTHVASDYARAIPVPAKR